MASTPNHAAQGALLTLAMLRLAQFIVAFWTFWMFPEWLMAACITLGAVLGALPDIAGWCGTTYGDGWAIYLDAHSGNIANRLKIFPQYLLHIKEDKLFNIDGDHSHWWPQMWWLEALLWGVNYMVWLILR